MLRIIVYLGGPGGCRQGDYRVPQRTVLTGVLMSPWRAGCYRSALTVYPEMFARPIITTTQQTPTITTPHSWHVFAFTTNYCRCLPHNRWLLDTLIGVCMRRPLIWRLLFGGPREERERHCGDYDVAIKLGGSLLWVILTCAVIDMNYFLIDCIYLPILSMCSLDERQ